MRTSLTERWGTDLPIIQAPMAGASGVAIAVGASAGGALASLPAGMMTPEQVESEVEAFREAADGPLNLNFFCHRLEKQVDDRAWRSLLRPYATELGISDGGAPPPLRRPYSADMVKVVERLRPEVVSFHFGLPDDDLLHQTRATGAFIIGNCTTVAEALWLAERGVDAVIAQGWEAGGHSGRFLPGDPAAGLGLFALLPQVVDVLDVPVIAAGGIGDGRGIAAALALGAAAVQIGTAYLSCPESLIAEPYRNALHSDAAARTLFTNLFSGGLARGIPNRLMEELGAVNSAAPSYPHASAAIAPLREAAEQRGLGDFSAMWAGQAAPLARAEPAKALTERLGREAEDRMIAIGDMLS